MRFTYLISFCSLCIDRTYQHINTNRRMGMQIYVSAGVLRSGDGSMEHPFKTIQEAANISVPGDEVLVAPGIYREWVRPVRSGT